MSLVQKSPTPQPFKGFGDKLVPIQRMCASSARGARMEGSSLLNYVIKEPAMESLMVISLV